MKLRTIASLAAVAALLVLGPARADDTEEDPFAAVQGADSAVIVDSKGVRIVATEFGKLFAMPRLTAFHGDSEIDIPFDRIRRIRTGEIRDNRLPVTVHLVSGREMQVVLDRTEYESMYGGKAEFGVFRIQLSDIREVTFVRPETRSASVARRCAAGHVYYNELWRYCPYDGGELNAPGEGVAIPR